MAFDYDEEVENTDYQEDLSDKVDNDEIDSSEAAFMQGYEEDEDNSFEEDEDNEEEEKDKKEE
jgi:hypothetical protein